MIDTRLLALEIAVSAHEGQRDKGGHPYILHPVQVASRVKEHDEQVVALLHDVVEDTDWTLDRLRDAGFSAAVVAAVDAITRRESESRQAYLTRCKADPIAKAVKIADLKHNMDLSRLAVVTERDVRRVEQYKKEVWDLTEVI